jgi:hypothetical protein
MTTTGASGSSGHVRRSRRAALLELVAVDAPVLLVLGGSGVAGAEGCALCTTPS